MANSGTTGPLTITLGVHTEMACVEPTYNTTEARYFAALGAIRTASITNGKLTLAGGGDTLVFARATS
jgi:heat shock protein HslJ